MRAAKRVLDLVARRHLLDGWAQEGVLPVVVALDDALQQQITRVLGLRQRRGNEGHLHSEK